MDEDLKQAIALNLLEKIPNFPLEEVKVEMSKGGVGKGAHNGR